VAATSLLFDQTIERFHHLTCFVEHDPNAAITVLLAAPPELRDAAEQALGGHGAFLHSVARAAADRASAVAASAVEFDDDTEALLTRLAENPRDGALLSVLQDHLQERGLPRGDLIALELSKVPDSARMVELKRLLWPVVKDVRVTWGTGFLRTMIITNPASTADAVEALQHPSARLVEELVMDRWAGPLPPVPASLRRLELRQCQGACASVGTLERLHHLELSDVDDAEALRSASLISLGVGRGLSAVPRAGALPLVRTLVVSTFESLPLLVSAGLLQHVKVLVFPELWDGAALDVLAETGSTWEQLLFPRFRPNEAQRHVLRRLSPCTAVMHVEGPGQSILHDSRPEWGLGRVRSRTNAALEVEFASGVRTLSPGIRVTPVEVLDVSAA
jgi:hypothetical protein